MKSTWVMTEEEKQDKKMRAMAKKSEGERAQKAKAPPKSANGTQPQTGTLQSYMARRKTCMHRRPSRSSSSTVTSEQVETVPKKQLQWQPMKCSVIESGYKTAATKATA